MGIIERDMVRQAIGNHDWDAATAILMPLLYEEPDDPEALSLLGIVYTESGRQEEALKALRFCFQLGYESVDALEAMGCCHLRLREYDKAEVWLTQALRLDESSPSLWRNLGVLYSLTNRPRECGEALKRSRELNPSDYLTLYALSTFFLHFGQNDQAREVLEQLELEAPEDLQIFARRALERLSHSQGH